MIVDPTGLADGARIEADVAVVGAGPVGIVLALELADAGLDVALVESGAVRPSAAAQELSDEASLDAERHAPMSMAVRRQLGGTSTIWGGRCVPYDRVDFDTRSVTGGAKWPISYDEVQPYLAAASRWLVCGRPVFDAGEASLPASIHPDLPAAEVSTSSLERWSLPTNFGREYRARLDRHPRIQVLTGLTCVGIAVEPPGRRVAHLACRRLTGQHVQVTARRYAIAAGGLESTRLLLASPGPDGVPLGNHADHLGRWYMGHVEGVIARIHLTGRPTDTIYDYERDLDGTYVRRRFSFSPDLQREAGLANIVAWLANPELADASHRSGPLSFAYLALASPLGRRFAPDAQRESLTGAKVPGSPYAGADASPVRAHLANLARDPRRTLGFVFGFGRRRFMGRPRAPGFFVASRDNTYPLQYHGEHLPHRDSRVTLSGKRDALGLPRLDIDLRFTAADVDVVLRAHEAWDAYLRRHGAGRLEYLAPDVADLAMSRMGGGFHQVGTTRMSSRPEDGVVDADLAVHGYPDLHVVGSSAFVTSSQANSTFMGVVLALRLAAHLRRQLVRPPTSLPRT